MVDATVCSTKWNDCNFKLKNIAEEVNLWNNAPSIIRNTTTLASAKREFKNRCSLLEL